MDTRRLRSPRPGFPFRRRILPEGELFAPVPPLLFPKKRARARPKAFLAPFDISDSMRKGPPRFMGVSAFPPSRAYGSGLGAMIDRLKRERGLSPAAPQLKPAWPYFSYQMPFDGLQTMNSDAPPAVTSLGTGTS